jgi:hypothetical protein
VDEAAFEVIGPALGLFASIIFEAAPAIELTLRTLGWSLILLFIPPWFVPIAVFARDSERHMVLPALLLGVAGAVLAWLVLRNVGASAQELPRLLALGLMNGAMAGLVPWLLISGLRYLSRRGPYSPGPF